MTRDLGRGFTSFLRVLVLQGRVPHLLTFDNAPTEGPSTRTGVVLIATDHDHPLDLIAFESRIDRRFISNDHALDQVQAGLHPCRVVLAKVERDVEHWEGFDT